MFAVYPKVIMIRKKAYLVISLFFLAQASFAFSSQITKIDSILSLEITYLEQVGMLKDISSKTLEEALKVEENESNKIKIINALCWKNFSSNPKKALEYAKMKMELAEKIKDKDALGVGYDDFGYLYKNTGDYEKSIDYFLKSLKIREEKKDSTGISVCLNGIGGLYTKMERYSEAMKYLLRTYQIYLKLGESEYLPSHVGNIGSCYLSMGNYDKALEYFLLAEHYADSLKQEQTATNLSNTGSAFMKKQQYEKANEYFLKALAATQARKDMPEEASVLIELSQLNIAQKNYSEAIKNGEKALKLAEENDLKDIILNAANTLAEIYSKTGNFQKAFEYQKKYSEIKDTVLTEASTRAITEMNTKYETEKKENEIKIQNLQINEQDLDLKKKQITIYASLLGILLLCVVTFFIFRGYKQKQRANKLLGQKNTLIEQQKKQVEEKNKDITDSIRYAKRLQSAILKPEQDISNYFKDGFVLFKPKDIVSGDFYWFEKFGNVSLISAADCTGHGVPGAFMSIIGCNLLSQAVNEHAITKPGAILNSVNKGLLKALQQKHEDAAVKDGMDIALCSFDSEKMMVEFAGAYNPMWILRDGKLIEIKGDKFPVGAFVGEQQRIFTNREFPVEKNDIIYFFSDGYADQFGGPSGKKFKYARMREMFLSNFKKPMKEQREIFSKIIEDWKGKLEQIDDILLMGIKI